MKKVSIILLAFVGIASNLMAQKGGYLIRGSAPADVQGIATLIDYTHETGQSRDTLPITNGHFTFKGNLKGKRHYLQVLIHSGNRDYSYVLYSEKGTINLDVRPGLTRYVLSGTPLNEDYSVYVNMVNDMVDSARKASGDNSLTQFTMSLYDAKFDVIARFVRKKPNSLAGIDQLDQFAYTYQNAEKVQSVFNLMTAKLRQSEIGIQLANRIKGMRTAIVGNQAPLFSSNDTTGKKVSLSDFKGKYVLVDFWATWCGPCFEEMPFIVKAYGKYRNRNFEILGVSLDNPRTKALWIKTIKEKNMSWPQVSELKGWESLAALLYNVQGVPANFLVDPSGTIIATNLRGEALEKKLSEVLL